MYFRFVKFDTEGTDLRQVQAFYRDRVPPLLERYGSCRFATLLQATSKDEECLSMTLWDSPEKDTPDGATEWRVTCGPSGSSTGPPVKGYQQIIGERL